MGTGGLPIVTVSELESGTSAVGQLTVIAAVPMDASKLAGTIAEMLDEVRIPVVSAAPFH